MGHSRKRGPSLPRRAPNPLWPPSRTTPQRSRSQLRRLLRCSCTAHRTSRCSGTLTTTSSRRTCCSSCGFSRRRVARRTTRTPTSATRSPRWCTAPSWQADRLRGSIPTTTSRRRSTRARSSGNALGCGRADLASGPRNPCSSKRSMDPALRGPSRRCSSRSKSRSATSRPRSTCSPGRRRFRFPMSQTRS